MMIVRMALYVVYACVFVIGLTACDGRNSSSSRGGEASASAASESMAGGVGGAGYEPPSVETLMSRLGTEAKEAIELFPPGPQRDFHLYMYGMRWHLSGDVRELDPFVRAADAYLVDPGEVGSDERFDREGLAMKSLSMLAWAWADIGPDASLQADIERLSIALADDPEDVVRSQAAKALMAVEAFHGGTLSLSARRALDRMLKDAYVEKVASDGLDAIVEDLASRGL